jgi:squalene-hopene/tetraprenyl-beta-curcumene cyclase
MNARFPKLFIFFAAVAALATAAEPSSTPVPSTYSGKAAAAYLDARLTWWSTWPVSARDHQTFCVSCHTALPYAMSRPALRRALGETGTAPIEQTLLANVTKRVRMWNDVEPFYPDATRGVPKTAESRGTESILNALVLASYESPDATAMSPDAQLAFHNMCATQLKTGDDKGSWSWLQFHNAPFEGDSQYYGSAMAAVAIGMAPGDYRTSPEIQEGLEALRQYLNRERDKQTLLDRTILLWASAKIPGLLTEPQKTAIINEALGKQQPDGGFSLSNFVGNWKRRDNTPLDTRSDGYTTGLVTYVLQRNGVKPDQPQMKSGLAWLMKNQVPGEGRWLSYSLNKERDLSSDVGRFMSDAATAYAVLALEQAR